MLFTYSFCVPPSCSLSLIISSLSLVPSPFKFSVYVCVLVCCRYFLLLSSLNPLALKIFYFCLFCWSLFFNYFFLFFLTALLFKFSFCLCFSSRWLFLIFFLISLIAIAFKNFCLLLARLLSLFFNDFLSFLRSRTF